MDWSVMKRLGPAGGIRALSAHFDAFSFIRHEHDYYVLGLIGDGLQQFELGKESFVTPPGYLMLINPGEPHTGGPAAANGFSYLALYPTAEDLVRFQEGADLRAPGGLAFPRTLVPDPDVHACLWSLGKVEGGDPLARETFFVLSLRELLSRHATCESHSTGPRRARR